MSVQQILRADRAAFLFLSERMTSMKRNATNKLPMDLALPTILSQPTVAFEKPSQAANRKRKGRTKGSQRQESWLECWSDQESIGNAPKTAPCWAFNLPNGCGKAKAGESCAKGIHLCAEPGCFKPHSLQDHR